MRAVEFREYGAPDLLRLEEVSNPQVSEDRVLVEVRAASVNSWDWDRLRGRPMWGRLGNGLRKPKNPRFGCDFAGVVAAIGPDVTDFSIGDEVMGDVSWFGFGAFAEYLTARQAWLAPKSPVLSFVQAAAVPQGGLLALQAIRLGDPEEGESVLINGAGGGSGSYAVQMALAAGAKVTGVDRGFKEETSGRPVPGSSTSKNVTTRRRGSGTTS